MIWYGTRRRLLSVLESLLLPESAVDRASGGAPLSLESRSIVLLVRRDMFQRFGSRVKSLMMIHEGFDDLEIISDVSPGMQESGWL